MDGLAETGAWLLNLGCAIDLPDAQGFPDNPPPLLPTWQSEIDGPLFAWFGKYAPGYQATTAEAVAVVAEWRETQGRGPWEASEGWAPLGEWIYPAQF